MGGVHSPPPAGVRGGEVVRHPSTPTRQMGGAVPREGGGSLLSCRQGLVGVLPAQSTLALEFFQRPFLRGGRCGCVRGAYSVHKPVCSEPCLMTRSATTSRSPSSLEDLDARRSH